MSFFLFVLVNATLFIRPAELVPEVKDWPIYEYLIISCLVLSIPEVLKHFSGASIDRQPITICVFGIFAAVILSQLAQLNLVEAARVAFQFFKVMVYYVLLVSVVNTPARLRRFLFWLVCFCTLLTVVTVAQYYGYVKLPTLKPLSDVKLDPLTAKQVTFLRLQGSGIFGDPNEFCVMLALAIPLCLYQMSSKKSPGQSGASVARFLWTIPLLLFGYAIALTHSRGGFLAFLTGLGAITLVRFGTRRALSLALLGLPLLLLVYAGRQTEMSPTEGTGQTRVQIWSDWLMKFRGHPIFGEGRELPPDSEDGDSSGESYSPEGPKKAAHNSHLHAFGELGFVGGMFFVGAFYFAVAGMYRLRPSQTTILDLQMAQMYPYVFGTVTACAVGLLSLSLCYRVPTYLILGLATVFQRMTPHYPETAEVRFELQNLGKIAVCSVMLLAVLYVFVRLFVRWG